jgi:hypothetical protein
MLKFILKNKKNVKVDTLQTLLKIIDKQSKGTLNV